MQLQSSKICFLYLLHLLHFLWRNLAHHEIRLSDLYISNQKRKTTFFLPISGISWSFQYFAIFLIRFTISAFLLLFLIGYGQNILCTPPLFVPFLQKGTKIIVSNTAKPLFHKWPTRHNAKGNLSRKQVCNNATQ